MTTFIPRGRGSYPAADGEWINSPGFPVPTKPVEEIVTISEEDGQFSNDVVYVYPLWEDYVASCEPYGMLLIDGSNDWPSEDMPYYITIYRGCLSILCHRTNTAQGL